MVDVQKILDKKVAKEELATIVKDQAIINESLCTENIIGRWSWKSGDIKPGQMIPWEVQLINTLPDNFIWEKDKTTILVIAPGLYEVGLPAAQQTSLHLSGSSQFILPDCMIL